EDYAPLLAKAKAAPPELYVAWDVNGFKSWVEESPQAALRHEVIVAIIEELSAQLVSRTKPVAGSLTAIFDKITGDQYTIQLLRGKNPSGDQIYAYVKMNMAQYNRFIEVMKQNKHFNVVDYGTVLAAGRGDPPDLVKRDLEIAFPFGTSTDPYLGPLGRGVKA